MKLTRTLGNLCLVMLSIVVALLFIEAAVRLSGIKVDKPINTAESQLKDYFVPDGELGRDIGKNKRKFAHALADGKTYQVWSNELGCFDNHYDGEKELIYLTGDSFAFGWTDFENKWGTLIEKELGIRVLKCGGFAESKSQLIKLKRVLHEIKVTPKLIIASYCIPNDLIDRWLYSGQVQTDGYLVGKKNLENVETGEIKILSEEEIEKKMIEWKDQKERKKSIFQKTKFWLSYNSYLYNKIRNNIQLRDFAASLGLVKGYDQGEEEELIRLLLPYIRPSEKRFSWLNNAWEIHLNDLKAFHDHAQTIGAEMLFVLIPLKEAVYDFLRDNVNGQLKKYNIDWNFPNETLQNFFIKNKINYLDLTPVFRLKANQRWRTDLDSEKDLYYKFDGHWTAKGDKLASLLVCKYILENKLMEVPDREKKLIEINQAISNFH